MTALSLDFLGPPRFTRGRAPVTLVRAKAAAVLLYLAVIGEAQPRDRVLDLLWPESAPSAARKNLRNTLWEIREALGADALDLNGSGLQLAPSVSVDVRAFESAVSRIDHGPTSALEPAAALYRGPLADGLTVHEAPEFELWLATERQRLAGTYVSLLQRIVTLARANGAWASVVAQARRALAVDALDEPMHLALIEAHLGLGQRSHAVRQYEALTDLLRRELAGAPLPETARRYQELLGGAAGVRVQGPVFRALPSVATRPDVPPEPFVGRVAELAALDEELARAARGEARVALISGDLGMGKSRLWQTWVSSHAAPAVVLATRALEMGEPVPFGPLLALFRQGGPARAILEPPSALAPIWLAELTRLLPELTTTWPGLSPPLALPPPQERSRLLHALAEAIRCLARPLLVLVVDDLHWADPSTLDWLVYLIDNLREAPLLVVGTYRPRDAPERLTAIVAGWQRQGRSRQIPLPHLTPDEARSLLDALGAPTDPEQVTRRVAQSGGNPYFLVELHRAPDREPPDDLAALVRARLHRIVPASAIPLLQAAAVLGDEADFVTLQSVGGRGEDETLDALDALVGAAVLVANGNGYRFVHPLIATVVRQDLTPARRAFLHRRAASALERAYAPNLEPMAGQLMEHHAGAGETIEAASYAETAAQRALDLGALIEAIAYARRALDWEVTPARQYLLGMALTQAGRASEGLSSLEAALAGFEERGDAVGATRAILHLTAATLFRSGPKAARSWLERAPIDRVLSEDPAVGVQVHLWFATVERHSRAYDRAAARFDQAAELVRRHRLPVQEGQLAFERANLLADRGDLAGAVATFEEALGLARSSGNPLQTALAENNLAYNLLRVGDIERAQAHAGAAAEIVERYALGFLRQFVESTAGEIALARGDLVAAEATLARAFASARRWGNTAQMANVRVTQALVARANDDRPAARALLDEARAFLGDVVEPVVLEKIARVSQSLDWRS